MCGIVGIIGTNQASFEIFQALLLLQHRGQDSAGISSFDSKTLKIYEHKELGKVNDIFDEKIISNLSGNLSIGHTRYSTIGEIKKTDLQPMTNNFPIAISMAHNGNISNYEELKLKLQKYSSFLKSDNDLELLLNLFSFEFYHFQNDGIDFLKNLEKTLSSVLSKAEGGYSVVSAIGHKGLLAFRDPHGIRPLIYGTKNDEFGKTAYCFASESSVLEFLGYTNLKEVAPGSFIFVDNENNFYEKKIIDKISLPCMFEWIYFSGADSKIANHNVHNVRMNLGKRLALQVQMSAILEDIDFVTPVPDTSRSTAVSLAENLNIPYREVLLKNRYIQRSFILNSHDKRNQAVKMKFSVLKEVIKGKNILLVDDSIVRGTTSKKIIKLLKESGANKIYMASSCPPVVSPCFYGIDFPSSAELIANGKSLKELESKLGVEKLFYTSIEDLNSALENIGHCKACLNGEYPYPLIKPINKTEVINEHESYL